MRSQSLPCRSNQLADGRQRSKSSPPSTIIPSRRSCRNLNVYFGRAGAPPAKAPPPMPPSDHRYCERTRFTRTCMRVNFAASGNLLITLAIDFTHTVRDVELAIHYHCQVRAKTIKPVPALCTQNLLGLCVSQNVWEVEVAVTSCNGKYSI